MYLRPGNIFKQFSVEVNKNPKAPNGRPKNEYETVENLTIKGVLAEAEPREIERWKQKQHPISHTIVQKGSPKANNNNRLVLDGRFFNIKGVDNIGGLGIWTIYYAEERNDGN